MSLRQCEIEFYIEALNDDHGINHRAFACLFNVITNKWGLKVAQRCNTLINGSDNRFYLKDKATVDAFRNVLLTHFPHD